MTSLIDVIFLLLLFFMLTSTFTRFAEVELASGGSGAGVSDTVPVFAQLGAEDLRVNGMPTDLAMIASELTRLKEQESADATPLLVSLKPGVTAQRLTDFLVGVRDVPGFTVTVLEES